MKVLEFNKMDSNFMYNIQFFFTVSRAPYDSQQNYTDG
jgi:hypothetical protein